MLPIFESGLRSQIVKYWFQMKQSKPIFDKQLQEGDPSMRRLLIRLWGFLSIKRRLQLCVLLLVMIGSSVSKF